MNDSTGMPQTAVVLGGTSEIARAVLEVLVGRRLRRVVLAGRDKAALELAGKELEALGLSTFATVVWDAAKGQARELAEKSASLLGEIDLVIVAAGLLEDQRRVESNPEMTELAITTNFTGPASAMTSLAGVLRSQGQGRIVVLSSVAAARVRRSNFVYGASKSGLDAFAQGLAEALRPDGVGVMIVRPGWVATRMTRGLSAPPMATTPDKVAADIVAGLERGSAVVWSPKKLKYFFAAFHLLPRAVWRHLDR